MNKTLAATLTAALMVGTSAVTFAAANPFSDVPADSWAYDAVTQLANDGIIDGYPDGTFRGQRDITRYEMAQMVAKAVAREDQANAKDRAMIQKLAAEFSTELNNLGVRVSNLEEKTDNVKWTGELRYDVDRPNYESHASDPHANRLQLRLYPQMQVNDHWNVKAQLRGTLNMANDSGAPNNNVTLREAYAQGKYGTTTYNAGKFSYFSEQGMVLDSQFSGASIDMGKGQPFNGIVYGGRLNDSSFSTPWNRGNSGVSSLYGLKGNWDVNDSVRLVGEYFHLQGVGQNSNFYGDHQNIWGLGTEYKVTDTVGLNGGYWKNHSVDGSNNHAYNVAVTYKGAQPENKGSFGLGLAYRYVGADTVIAPTWNDAMAGTKGWAVSGQYTFTKNVVGKLWYFNGKEILENGMSSDRDKVSRLFGRVQFFF